MFRRLTRRVVELQGAAVTRRHFAAGGVSQTNHFANDAPLSVDSSTLADPLIYHVPVTSTRTVGRDQDVVSLWQRLLSGKKVQVISGIDGLGKSTIAAEFCDAAKRSGRFSCIHWFNGVHSAKEQLESFFRMMVGRKEKDVLLVLDDVADVEAVVKFLPDVKGLYVLLTTRHDVADVNLAVYRPAPLPPTSSNELYAHTGTSEDAAAVCEAVQYVPLLMQLAMALVSEDVLSSSSLREAIAKVEGTQDGVFSVSKVLHALVEIAVSHLEKSIPQARLALAAVSCCHLADVGVPLIDGIVGDSTLSAEFLLRCTELGILTQKWTKEAMSIHPSVARALRQAGPKEACDVAAKALLNLWPRRWRAMDTDNALMLVYHTVAVSEAYKAVQRPLSVEIMASMDRGATFCAHAEGKQLHLALQLWTGIIEHYLAQKDVQRRELARVALEAGRICYVTGLRKEAEAFLRTAFDASRAAFGEMSVEAALVLPCLCAFMPNDAATGETLKVGAAALRAKLSSVDDILKKEERQMIQESLYVVLSRLAYVEDTLAPGNCPESIINEMDALSAVLKRE